MGHPVVELRSLVGLAEQKLLGGTVLNAERVRLAVLGPKKEDRPQRRDGDRASDSSDNVDRE